METDLTALVRETAESFHLRMPAAILRKITELARKEHRTTANMLRLLLLEALEARKEKSQ
jgi:hypothetical protein